MNKISNYISVLGISLIIFLPYNAVSQAPNKFSFQAVIRNSSNSLVTNQSIGMRISILQTSANGSAVYAETQNPTTNINGLASLEIGGGTVVSGNFSSINWANGPYFIKTETDPTGGTNYTIIGVTQMLSVPYALFAENAGNSTPGPQGEQGPQGAPGQDGLNGTNGNGIASTVDNGDGTFTFIYDDGSVFTTSDLTGPQGAVGPEGLLPIGLVAGNTPFWNGSTWVVNNSNIHNNGAEVGIGTTSPNSSAKLEIFSNSQGFLPPRLTSIERDAIISPAIGLVIYNSTTNCLNFFIGNGWSESCGSLIGTITSLDCGAVTNTGTLISGVLTSGVSSNIPYTGGNGGTHIGQTVTSTGVTGLTATLTAGTFSSGNGDLTYTITGTPSATGTAIFALNIGGQTCTFYFSVVSILSLQYPNGSVFCNSGPTAIVDVTNPTTGKTWMDRNLGASQVATSSMDANAYGDLYQWGRRSDGHQCRTSQIITTLSSLDQPNHGNFIKALNSPYDWRSPQNSNLWQGVIGINNPCPSGYRIPSETELNAEYLTWSSNNAAGAFASPLKLPMAGYRNTAGSLNQIGSYALYWSSAVNGTASRYLYFGVGDLGITGSVRISGLSVRCIKN
jgi:uncharacterized protein (TIGR02145 family)